MATLFLDTSALVKRYIAESGSDWVIDQCDATKNAITISQATYVEAVTTFCRRAREINTSSRIAFDKRDELISLFRQDILEEYEPVKVTKTIYKNAGNLCRIHRLRAYDAVQLACALAIRTKLRGSLSPAPIFVSADNKLLDIASLEGFAIDNPNNHP